MPSRFTSGVYGPELVELMTAALEAAWAKFDPPPKDGDLARLHLASAIIDAVEAGEREPEVIAAKAVDALREAVKLTSAILAKRPPEDPAATPSEAK
jgi:hypothetical protein